MKNDLNMKYEKDTISFLDDLEVHFSNFENLTQIGFDYFSVSQVLLFLKHLGT